MTISWLNDVVFVVRETAVDSIKRIIQQFGSEWAVSSGFLEGLLEFAQHRNYLRRVTFLIALGNLSPVLDPKALQSHIIPALEKLSSDPIANVRFNVAKTIEETIPILTASEESRLKETIGTTIIPMLQQLQRDADADVRDFATRTLNLIPVF